MRIELAAAGVLGALAAATLLLARRRRPSALSPHVWRGSDLAGQEWTRPLLPGHVVELRAALAATRGIVHGLHISRIPAADALCRVPLRPGRCRGRPRFCVAAQLSVRRQ
jgi:hypothetical protein